MYQTSVLICNETCGTCSQRLGGDFVLDSCSLMMLGRLFETGDDLLDVGKMSEKV